MEPAPIAGDEIVEGVEGVVITGGPLSDGTVLAGTDTPELTVGAKGATVVAGPGV